MALMALEGPGRSRLGMGFGSAAWGRGDPKCRILRATQEGKPMKKDPVGSRGKRGTLRSGGQ